MWPEPPGHTKGSTKTCIPPKIFNSIYKSVYEVMTDHAVDIPCSKYSPASAVSSPKTRQL